ncbi:MAG: tetratricopeptide repeat protein [candidate division KSB1 bacterium]|nr:tetratricopeptide repeat protein [candidate division KSB1 bacterium]MDZ7273899.1 tetratricopeptide repeat protein [candidate division KSB1 bacterium]MDZ7286055.1 tetratricopeptide repeat protein [candidate division KSB1 bacterium]MDZ7299087.1 tetratricopeptide repeat protein [candidate division KSB1 bacterium]MDZ7306390.1 tetratricopeptide repeat protein [candidate division KSB1 bacterium]
MRQSFLQTCLGVVLLFSLAAPAALQTKNERAARLLEAGLRESTPARKISAFTRALALDPDFVEAAFNLGLVYKQLQDHTRAEQFFLRARQSCTASTSRDLQLAVLYELALTYKRLNKEQRYESALREAGSLAREEQIGGTIAFELGRFLYQQGRLEEALAELREGERLYPAQRQQFANLARLVENARALQGLRTTAQQAEMAGRLQEARSLYEQLVRQLPDDQNARARLAAVTEKLQRQQEEASWQALYQRAQTLAAEGKWEEAIHAYEALLEKAGEYRDARARLRQALEQLELSHAAAQRQRQLEEVEQLYDTAMSAFNRQEWTTAIVAFEKIMAIMPHFQDTASRLASARQRLEQETARASVAALYEEGRAAFALGDWPAAVRVLQQGAQLDPTFKDINALLAEARRQLQQARETQAPQSLSEDTRVWHDSLYAAARTAMANEDWGRAILLLEKLRQAAPDDPELAALLAQARVNLTLVASELPSVNVAGGLGSALFIGGAVTGLILLPLLGFVVFSPEARARFYLLQGKYDAAARIYEKLLQDKPNRVRFYPTLASIYLLAGRRDETALEVYKTVLQLNLTTRNREEINAIVAQAYLSQGVSDTQAIKILEEALRAEVRGRNKRTEAG